MARIALALLVVAALMGCGGREEHDTPASRVAAACGSSCATTLGACNLPPVVVQDCSAVCQLGYSIAPSCSDNYASYVSCAESHPILACSGTGITVQVMIPPCLDQLGSYITCAASQILPACLALPLDDGACSAAKLGAHAQACVGQPPGCALLTGTVQAGGFGIFCCP